MFRNVTIYQNEIQKTIKKFQDQGCTVILRRYIEDDVKAHPEDYPKLATLDEIPRKMTITATVNRMPGTKMYF
ncbi:hypothetical protein [Methanospirillum lacunae]|uniref:Uncharacterized protein n=1 Tax=Methanospirillum lacunae TaxID=668570 RepID=A0A2V2N614_9EURY|nr:hypothetical protein [Methanospirillum lacunae]PWR73945.1 hypothetical protein DK846_01915 [Methanospirillum lacunae]